MTRARRLRSRVRFCAFDLPEMTMTSLGPATWQLPIAKTSEFQRDVLAKRAKNSSIFPV